MIVEKLKTWALLALGFFAAVGAAFVVGRVRGGNDAEEAAAAHQLELDLQMEQDKNRQVIDAGLQRRQIDQDVRELPPNAARQELRDRWIRR